MPAKKTPAELAWWCEVHLEVRAKSNEEYFVDTEQLNWPKTWVLVVTTQIA
jgi:hypothetical protein